MRSLKSISGEFARKSEEREGTPKANNSRAVVRLGRSDNIRSIVATNGGGLFVLVYKNDFYRFFLSGIFFSEGKMESIFKGVATALITPMKESGEVDYEAFGRLIDWQIESGINALVVCGTTGECATLDDDEHKKVIEFCVKRTAKRVPVIAGTGGNDTAYAIKLSKHAKEVGADACLLVTPYYNKATQKGLVKMFGEIAESVDLPMIVYNVPSRTGVNIEPKTYLELTRFKNIRAIKEANGNISKAVETMSLVGDKLDMYSGNDDQVVPLMSIGAKGVISVLSNLMPEETVEMCDLFFEGKVNKSAKKQLEYKALIDALFCEVNPIPVKSAMWKMGYGSEYLRSPLTVMEEEHKEKMFKLMQELGVI